eukprot:scaffold15998_cov111-Isochrysis_galbana.AAC.10
MRGTVRQARCGSLPGRSLSTPPPSRALPGSRSLGMFLNATSVCGMARASTGVQVERDCRSPHSPHMSVLNLVGRARSTRQEIAAANEPADRPQFFPYTMAESSTCSRKSTWCACEQGGNAQADSRGSVR